MRDHDEIRDPGLKAVAQRLRRERPVLRAEELARVKERAKAKARLKAKGDGPGR